MCSAVNTDFYCVFLWEHMEIYVNNVVTYYQGVGTMPKSKEKVEEIKMRVTKQEKQLIKAAAMAKGITMTEFILDMVVPTAKRHLESAENQNNINNRINRFEENINFLRGNMNDRRSHAKKNKIKSIFARKS